MNVESDNRGNTTEVPPSADAGDTVLAAGASAAAPDESVAVGDVRVQSGDAVLIANLENYLAVIETRLLEAI